MQEPAPEGDVQVEATVEVPEAPEMVEVDTAPGVQVVYDTDVPVFYSDNFYWRYDGGVWLRSSNHTGGFVVYNDVPDRIRHIDRPTTYSHYRPSTYVPRAQRPGYVAPHRTTTTVRQPGYREPTHTGRPYQNTTPVRQQPTYQGTQSAPVRQTQPTYHQPAGTTTRPYQGTQSAPVQQKQPTYQQPAYGQTRPTGTTYGNTPRPTTPTTTRPGGTYKPPTPATTKGTTYKKDKDKDKK